MMAEGQRSLNERSQRGGEGPLRFAHSQTSWLGASWALLLLVVPAAAQSLRLPTANRALLEPGGEERYFVGTIGKPWTSGTFGCVRTDGWQFHEGLDIRCLQRARGGEPADPILATADGTVMHVNRRPSLSNYGNYLIIRHIIDGVDIYSLYAHLGQVRADLRPGMAVKAGESVGVMGRTSNTRERISKERAHVHFELNLLASDRYAAWHAKHRIGQRNDHGDWNGQNLVGLDPREILQSAHRQGARFNLAEYVRHQPELCRVVVRAASFPWVRRYPMLIQRNPVAERDGAAGYELALSFNGVPFQLIPRAASEIKSKSRVQLLSVNEAEYNRAHCRKLVTKRSGRWQLAPNGENLISLLTF